MHAGQHPTALMGAIYHQQILQQQPVAVGAGAVAVAAAATSTQPINGQPVATQPNQQQQLPVTRRERKLSRSEDGATLAAANGGVVGRSTEV